jgi:hypothetical protein
MIITNTQRRIGLGCALMLAAAMTVMGGDQSTQDSASSMIAPSTDSTQTATRSTFLHMAKLARVAPSADGVDVFAPKSWAAAPRPAAPAPPPGPSPQALAPPIPFHYIGQIEGRKGLTIVLSRGAESFSVRAGEAIDQNYRVENVSPVAVTLVYLPLNERQALVLESK